MKKGFTLIELLAVIVILAIIALIATPIVLNIISDTKESAGLRSADFYLDAVEFSISNATLNNNDVKDGTYNILENGNICLKYNEDDKCIDTLEVEVKGEMPSSGTITITNGNITEVEIVLNDKTIVKNEEGELEIQEEPKTLADAILKSYGGKDSITEVTDFSIVNTGLYKAEDDLGTSYYFRGDVKNNYVQLGTYENNIWTSFYYCPECDNQFNTLEECEQFESEMSADPSCVQTEKAGQPMYWRIVRINGDGTIRLIYDGAEKVENGQKKITFTSRAIYPATVSLGWYNDHLKNDYDEYIVNSIFGTDDNVSNCEQIEIAGQTCWNNSYVRFINKTPSLKLNTSDVNSFRNKVGLITIDEIIMAGEGDNSYISTSSSYTPSNLFGTHEYVAPSMSMASNHIFSSDASSISYMITDARPVINLKADVKFKGKGTIDSPYEIITE